MEPSSPRSKLQATVFSFSTLLAFCTVIVSLGVAHIVNGSFSENVRIVDLVRWGGITWEKFTAGEIWLLGSSQMVHVKIPHMFFNVACLFCVGIYMERIAGWKSVFVLWLLAGGVATLISPLWIEPPYNVGTGASHAVLALGGFAAVLLTQTQWRSCLGVAATVVAIVPPFLIDFGFAGYAKPGHIVGLALGVLLGAVFVKLKKSNITTQ